MLIWYEILFMLVLFFISVAHIKKLRIREDNETLPSLSNILYVASVSCKNEGEWFSNLIIGHVISLFRWIDCVPSQFMSKSNGNDILRKVQQAIILEKTVIIYAPLDFSIVINKYILGNGIFFFRVGVKYILLILLSSVIREPGYLD